MKNKTERNMKPLAGRVAVLLLGFAAFAVLANQAARFVEASSTAIDIIAPRSNPEPPRVTSVANGRPGRSSPTSARLP